MKEGDPIRLVVPADADDADYFFLDGAEGYVTEVDGDHIFVRVSVNGWVCAGHVPKSWIMITRFEAE